MAGEPILIIDDTPVNLKLTRILLVNEGYQVRTAPDAEQALQMLETYHPELMLVDIQLPGMNGLDFTRKVKADARWRDIPVVALTAFAMKGDEQKAIAAGCDGYITKPIDTRTLPGKLREYLATRGPADGKTAPPAANPAAPPPANDAFSLAGPEIDALRRRFLEEGMAAGKQFLDTLDIGFDTVTARRTLHQWVGAAGLLGYPQISQLSREIEQLLAERPLDNAQLRELLTRMIYAFCDVPEAQPVEIPSAIVDSLRGKRFALVGFADLEAERMCAALARVQALPRLLPAAEPPDSGSISDCDAVLVHVRSDTMTTEWLAPRSVTPINKPTVLVGDRDSLLALDPAVQARAQEFLMDAWQAEEALMRTSIALARAAEPGPGTGAVPGGREYPRANSRPQIVLADDDPTVLSLVRATLLNYGMEVRAANNGAEGLQMIEASPPDAAILDVNMPGMDGFELLAAVRTRNLPVRVILLTARQQEGDLVRGFTLGADDYVVKPFSPMELMARLKRLLWR